MIEFTVPGNPTGQPRQRHRIVKAGGRTFASNYLPKSDPVNAFKATIRLAYQAAGGRLLDLDDNEAISVVILAVFPRPKSKTRKTQPNPRLRKTSKPDVDNIAKAVLDGLNGVAWPDDAAVSDLVVQKHLASADEDPHTTISISIVSV